MPSIMHRHLTTIPAVPVEISHLECIGHHHEQTDLRLTATRHGESIGHLAVCRYNGDLHVQAIEVNQSERRNGIATQMLIKLREEEDRGWLRLNLLTDEGAAFFVRHGLYRGNAKLPVPALQDVHPTLRPDAFREMIRHASPDSSVTGLELKTFHPQDGERWGTVFGPGDRVAPYLASWLGEEGLSRYPSHRRIVALTVNDEGVRVAFKDTAGGA